ncbi:lysophospholipid acyltransferase family protein [Pseudooceanicola sp. C21-150M6]|uniref:lysophospholipid acyltransferase family protein n=1 Tax=Pseudooceanicola sp. C21-150M6 TaxID=3434355 RepID=UPI003D7F267C
MQGLRSLLFVAQMYLAMLLLGLVFAGFAVFDRRAAYTGVRTYSRYVRWTAGLMVGLRTEVRGTIPVDEVLIASKHQSFLDIILLVSVLPRPKFIMKDSLRYAPILGWYAQRIGCVPVNRGRRAEAIRQMMAGVRAGHALPGQLIIYPQGTRVAPGAYLPYKQGVAAIYEELGQPCVPAATNVGLFWPRKGIYRKPGLAVVEFLDPIPPNLPRGDFLDRLETGIEARSNQLMRDGGFTGGGLPTDQPN